MPFNIKVTSMTWSRTKTAVVAGAILLLIVGIAVVIVGISHRHSRPQLQWTPGDKLRYEAENGRRINNAKISVVASRQFADAHQDQWPTSFAQLNAQHPESRLTDSDWEFLSGGNRVGFTSPDRTVLFRERVSRPSPDGGFARVYAFADTSIQVLISPNDDFKAVEKQRGYLIHPASN